MNWALAAAAAFCLGMFIAVAMVGAPNGAANAVTAEQSEAGAQPLILFSSPGATAFSIEDGAFYSENSLYVPLAMAAVDEQELIARNIDLERARHAAIVMGALNTALAQTDFKTYRSYADAVAMGLRPPHAAVEEAYQAAAALSAKECMNLRRALDHFAQTGKTTADADLMRTGARSGPWNSAAGATGREIEGAL